VLKVIPDEATRLAALKGGEVDIAYSIRGELADELQKTPGLSLKAAVPGSQWLYFADQWNPDSPWHDERVRKAANLAMDRQGINQAITLGQSHLTNSIIPESFEFYWQPPAPIYDPAKAKALLAEAGRASGFDAGEFFCDASYSNVAEALANNFAEIGIKSRLRPLERAAFFKAYAEKTLKNIIYGGSGAFGNAATRMEAFYVKGGTYAYGSYPDIDDLFQQQAVELDHQKRAAILEKMQLMAHERAIYAPIWLLGFLNGVGPRVGESGFGLIPGYAYTAPYEDITLRGT
jgi:peptide/nickel transport system substrate-binding protein